MQETANPDRALRETRREAGGPAAAGEAEFVIRADGLWIHQGRPIERPALVRLFASVLRVEDGEHWLVTPIERVRVSVEDAALLAIEAVFEEPDVIVLRDNVGGAHPLGPERRLAPRRRGDGSIAPYLALDRGLEARVARNAYYHLAERAIEGPGGVGGIWAGGVFHPLDLAP